MPARLTDEEREARRKERVSRSFDDAAYRHYDPNDGGYGRKADWARMAEALAAGLGYAQDTRGLDPADRDALAALGIHDLPIDVSGVKSAFRRSAQTAHPDHGGTDEQFKTVYAAYERLLNRYR